MKTKNHESVVNRSQRPEVLKGDVMERITYSSLNTDIATIDEMGRITAIALGKIKLY